jgi:hypothetical protein
MSLNRPVNIVEIIKKAEQGRSEPYICEGEDGKRYYVKGRQSGARTPITEWIAAHLAQALGLPIANFRLAYISAELLATTPADLKPIGECIAFASQEAPFTCWLEPANIYKVPESLQRDLLVFDWWLRNDDRNRGNINLLWNSDEQALVVIDHNLAFDSEFKAKDFLQAHPFSHHWDAITSDMMVRLAYQERLEATLPAFEHAKASIPPSWFWVDKEETIPNTINLNDFKALLERCHTDEFWRAE